VRAPVLVAIVFASLSGVATAEHGWAGAAGDALSARFQPPPGFTRVTATGFGAWLRELPLQPAGSPVLLFDGRPKPRQDVHAAVIAIDIGKRDLQQCADAVMRLRAEYLWEQRSPVEFHPDPGKARVLRFDPKSADRKRFEKYLVGVFADAGSASLQAELMKAKAPVEPGDVLIQGGYPGHAVLVLDVAADEAGHRRLLLAQSYMPAQSIHVLLVDPQHPDKGAWFDEATLDGPIGLVTPEWRPFHRGDVRRFR
jgi:hypothetical protein